MTRSPSWILDPERDVFPELADPSDARLLLTHPRSARLTMDGGCFRYWNPSTNRLIPLSGLTKPLLALYWPTYRPMSTTASPIGRALKRAAAGKRGRLPAVRLKPALPKTDAERTQEAATSHVRGSIVHRHIHDWFTLDTASFDARNPAGMHPWAKRLVQQCLQRGWLPLKSQYGVYDENMGIATEIDSVWVRKDGTLVFLEQKTGKSRALFHWQEPAVPMTGVAQEMGVPGSALGRAKIQLAVSVVMAAKGMGNNFKHDFESWVVFVCDETIEFIPIEKSFLLNAGVAIYRDMTARVPELRRKKREQARTRALTPPPPPPLPVPPTTAPAGEKKH